MNAALSERGDGKSHDTEEGGEEAHGEIRRINDGKTAKLSVLKG